MERTHDTLTGLGFGTPWWFTLSARAFPIALLVQFLSAGLALFHADGFRDLHTAFGMVLFVPAAALCAGPLLVPRLRGFNWWAAAVFLLYLGQVALAADRSSGLLSLHPFNGALLLTASLVLLAKVERRLGRQARHG